MNFKKILILLFFSMLSWIYAQEKTIYDYSVKDIQGNEISLSDYEGKVLLIVNVASKCGFTYQYEGLEELYQQYQDEGLVILGFPANDFLWQEPGSDEEILNFCRSNYDVTFPMFSKIKVTGTDKEPLYDFLTSGDGNEELQGRISWNFNKFLINRQGRIVDRFDSKVEPMSDEILQSLVSQL